MKNNMSAKRLALIGMLGALGAILMMFRFPIPFMPPFLSFDLATGADWSLCPWTGGRCFDCLYPCHGSDGDFRLQFHVYRGITELFAWRCADSASRPALSSQKDTEGGTSGNDGRNTGQYIYCRTDQFVFDNSILCCPV